MLPGSYKINLGLAAVLVLLIVISVPVLTIAQTNTDQLEKGRQLYLENCAVCHGPEGEGRVGANLNKNWPSIRPDLTVRTIVEDGVPGSVMPAFGSLNGGPLSDQEMDALMDYILSWQTGESADLPPVPSATPRKPITPEPQVQGDPNRGAVLFDNNCVVCHGPDGRGRIGKNLNKAWSGVRPDLTIKSTISKGIPESAMPAWQQEYGGPLLEDDVNDLVAYLLSQSDQPSGQADTTVEVVSPRQFSWLRGWGGIFLFFVLLVLIIGGAIYYQQRNNPESKEQ